jgi:hypothetical protein
MENYHLFLSMLLASDNDKVMLAYAPNEDGSKGSLT